MKENEIYNELNSIRDLMERSAKFISLSGLSGIMAGIYAILGAVLGYYLVYGPHGSLQYRTYFVADQEVLWKLSFIALAVLLFSLITGLFLTLRKAKMKNQNVWNPSSKKLLASVSVPLFTGGIFILILLFRGYYEVIAPTCLIFYGLALVSGSHYTYTDVKWLGFLEIILGLFATLLPGCGIVFWTIGFGVLHIIYGSIMHFKYDR